MTLGKTRLAATLTITAGLAAGLAFQGCGDSPGDALKTERQKRASSIELPRNERLLWGNFVVRAAGDEEVELTGVELRGATGAKVRRLLVADGSRPQSRVLVFGTRDFRRRPDYEKWVAAFKPLDGYTVKPTKEGSDPSQTESGQWRDTEIVVELEPPEGDLQVRKGIRLSYRVGGEEGHIDLPNQLTACSPLPCRPPKPVGF